MTSLLRHCLMVCHSRQSACSGLIGNPEKKRNKSFLDSRLPERRPGLTRTEKRLFSESPTNFGFTLIEILVALIIVTVTVSVVLGSQLVALKTEQKARALQAFRFETQRIFSVTHRAKNEQQLMELMTTNNLCRVKSEPVQIESGTNVLNFIRHELNTEALPSFSSVFYTRPPEVPAPLDAWPTPPK